MLKLKVNGMTCGRCAKRVTTALTRVPNVKLVEVDLARGEALIEGDVDVSAALDAAKSAGYDASPLR
jgi:copper chaperone